MHIQVLNPLYQRYLNTVLRQDFPLMRAKKTAKCQYYYNCTFYDAEGIEENWLLVTLQ